MRAYHQACLLAIFVSIGAAETAEPSPRKYFNFEQRAGLVETEQLGPVAIALRDAGKYAESLVVAEQVLAIQRAVGDYDQKIVLTVEFISDLRWRLDDFSGAVRARQEIVEFRTRQFGADHWQTTNARRAVERGALHASLTGAQRAELNKVSELTNQAAKLFGAGKYAETLAPAQQAVAIRRALLGEHDPDYAASLSLLARMYKALRDFERAEKLLAAALTIQQQALGESHPDCATTMGYLAAVYDDLGLPAKSLPLWQQSLAIRKQALGERSAYYGQSLDALANWYKAAGEYAKAEPLFRQSLGIYRELYGERHAYYAVALNNLGRLHTQAGDYAQAQEILEQSLALQKEISGEKDPGYVVNLADLAFLANRVGDHEQAVLLYTQAAALDKERLGEKHYRYALRIGNLAATFAEMGEYGRAEPLYRQSMQITKDQFGELHPKYAAELNHLAMLYLRMGDHSKAEPLLRQSLAIRKSTLGEKHRDTSESLSNLSKVFAVVGDHQLAVQLLEQTLEIRRSVLGDRHQDVAETLHNLGTRYAEQNQFDQAAKFYRQAVETMRAAVGPRHPGNAVMLQSLAWLHARIGDYDAAKPLYVEALAIAKQSLGVRSDYRLQILKNLAALYQCTGEFDKAEPLILEALQLGREQLDLTAALQSERQQMAMRFTVWDFLDAYLDLTGHSHPPSAEVYAHVLQWKGEVGARQQQLRRTRRLAAEKNPAVARLLSELDVTARGMAWAASSRALSESDGQTRLATLRDQFEKLQTELTAASADFQQELTQQQRTPDDICRALPEGVVLVDFLTPRYYIPAPTKGQPGNWQRHLIAFVARRDRPIERVELGPAEPIEQKILAWRKRFGAKSSDVDPGADLRRLLWEPISPLLKDAQLLLVSPNATTAPLPWAALPGKTPGTYLIEEIAVAVVPIPSLLPDLLVDPLATPATSMAAPGLLLVGDVDFDAAASATETAPTQPPTNGKPLAVQVAVRGAEPLAWKALPGTRDEIAALKTSYQERFGGAAPTELTQQQATKQAVCQAVGNHHFLHFSTHGFFSPPQFQSASSARDADRRDISVLETTRGPVGQDPGLLSGLVLAGANHVPTEGEADGILTALEVAELELGQVQLATLSACETGLGESAGGEGLLGLQRAFQTAGAKTVVAGLWKVPDQATQILMTRFYRNLWQQKMSRIEALVAAQRSMLDMTLAERDMLRGLDLDANQPQLGATERLSPFYWAAFTLSGDWR